MHRNVLKHTTVMVKDTLILRILLSRSVLLGFSLKLCCVFHVFIDKRIRFFKRREGVCWRVLSGSRLLSRDRNDNGYFLSVQQNHLALQSSWNAPWKPCSSLRAKQWTAAMMSSLIQTHTLNHHMYPTDVQNIVLFHKMLILKCILERMSKKWWDELRRAELRKERRRHNSGFGVEEQLLHVLSILQHVCNTAHWSGH